MNFNGTYIEKKYDENKAVYITFKVENWSDKQVIEGLEKEALYRLTASQARSKRTIEQNNYLWALIHEISIAQNGEGATSSDDWDVYIQALERAQAKFEFVACLPEAVPLFKNQFRAVREMNEFEHKGKTFKQLKVFYGSSKMDTKEMAQLLNTVIEMAAQEGIELTEYRYD